MIMGQGDPAQDLAQGRPPPQEAASFIPLVDLRLCPASNSDSEGLRGTQNPC